MTKVGSLNVDMRDAVKGLTFEVVVTGQRRFRARLWLGANLIRFAGWIIGGGVEISIVEDGDFDEVDRAPKAFDGNRVRNYVNIGGVAVPTAGSVDQRSPLYSGDLEAMIPIPFDIYLDGVRQDRVVSYDAEQGFVRVHRLSKAGDFQVEDGSVLTDVLRGKVELRAQER